MSFSYRICIAAVLLPVSAVAIAQSPPTPLVKENATVKISEHVYVIPDGCVPAVPNVGFIVGRNATMIVDTGLGQRNGEAIVRELNKVSKNTTVYAATTHFHPEHTTGGLAFPAGTKFVRPQIQQQDIVEYGDEMLGIFRKRSAETEELMKGTGYPRVDQSFEREQVIDLGGVRVKLTMLGPAHTRGDTAIFVEGDNVLFSGDLAMKGMFPAFATKFSNAQVWLKSLDALDAMHPAKIVPSHCEMGDAAMIKDWRAYLTALQARVRELKAQGKSADDAAKELQSEFQAKYASWQQGVRIGPAVRAIYAESP